MSQTVEYRQCGDYLLPVFAVPESVLLGVWGLRRREFLREHKKGVYTALLLNGKLDSHLAEIDREAGEMFSRLVEQMKKARGITEELKARDQLTWVGAMNNIRNAAEEIVRKELICGQESPTRP